MSRLVTPEPSDPSLIHQPVNLKIYTEEAAGSHELQLEFKKNFFKICEQDVCLLLCNKETSGTSGVQAIGSRFKVKYNLY